MARDNYNELEAKLCQLDQSASSVRTHSTAVDTRDGRTIEAASKRTQKRAAAVKPELK